MMDWRRQTLKPWCLVSKIVGSFKIKSITTSAHKPQQRPAFTPHPWWSLIWQMACLVQVDEALSETWQCFTICRDLITDTRPRSHPALLAAAGGYFARCYQRESAIFASCICVATLALLQAFTAVVALGFWQSALDEKCINSKKQHQTSL